MTAEDEIRIRLERYERALDTGDADLAPRATRPTRS
jgi:hypothetical protein